MNVKQLHNSAIRDFGEFLETHNWFCYDQELQTKMLYIVNHGHGDKINVHHKDFRWHIDTLCAKVRRSLPPTPDASYPYIEMLLRSTIPNIKEFLATHDWFHYDRELQCKMLYLANNGCSKEIDVYNENIRCHIEMLCVSARRRFWMRCSEQHLRDQLSSAHWGESVLHCCSSAANA